MKQLIRTIIKKNAIKFLFFINFQNLTNRSGNISKHEKQIYLYIYNISHTLFQF